MTPLEARTYEVLRATAEQERKRTSKQHRVICSGNRNQLGVKDREFAQWLRQQ